MSLRSHEIVVSPTRSQIEAKKPKDKASIQTSQKK